MKFNVQRLGYNTFDVFEGKQWGSWSRLRAGKNGVYVSQGDKLPYSVVKALAKEINPTLAKQEVVLQ